MTRKAIEELATELHEVYMKEATRQGDVRHAEDYSELPENIKEFDRALARFILSRERLLLEKIIEPMKKINPNWDGYVWIHDDYYTPIPKNLTRFNLREHLAIIEKESEQ
jgi:hypothetical protein